MKRKQQIPLMQINKYLPSKIDLFLSFISYEKRCVVIPMNLSASRIKKASFFINKFSRKTKSGRLKHTNELLLRNYFKNKFNIEILEKNNPLQIVNVFIEKLWPYINSKSNIVIDITTFTHESLLIILRILIHYKNSVKIYLLYNPATDYSTQYREPENKWLSKGIKEIRSVLGYPGQFKSYQKLHLVVLVGYEYEKALKLVETLEPSLISLGVPNPAESISSSLHKINIQKYDRLLSFFNQENINKFSFSCINPLLTKNNLAEYLKKYKLYNNVIIPMNNKVSTVGCGLYAISNPKVQLYYASARLYNFTNYSSPSDFCMLYKFNDLKKNNG